MLSSFEKSVCTYHRVKYGHNYGSFESVDTLLETPKPHFAVHMDIIKTSLKIPKGVEFPIKRFFFKDVLN